jgi:hypothetical protein
VSTHLDLTGSFTLLPVNQPSMKIIDDVSMTGAIANSLKVTCRTFQWPSLTINVNGTPAPLSFDVFVRAAGTETKAGYFACPAGTTAHGYGMQVTGAAAKPKTFDVILRINLDAALNTLDTFEAWKGEIVLKNVPVK